VCVFVCVCVRVEFDAETHAAFMKRKPKQLQIVLFILQHTQLLKLCMYLECNIKTSK
jgi:hypothetical protein